MQMRLIDFNNEFKIRKNFYHLGGRIGSEGKRPGDNINFHWKIDLISRHSVSETGTTKTGIFLKTSQNFSVKSMEYENSRAAD